ncbi:HutD family protein [Shinella sp. CPCC 101442]|uniref:HutD/Ves family protein n=1 Tax=Shinella sp. CPCC 101442 TaxID=2932265 RepID=UPI002152585F|nr:HutD family protein [Shinella sp. CPCC 101442]MCR6498621.1 HutD family protein [Shinella sp. CPCC 101442]
MRLLRNSDHRRMPWKNGGGETVEVIVTPEGASLSDFGWRVSMATVASDGPFSVFPGIDRTLAVLSGDGMALSIEGLGDKLLTPVCAPLAFPADAPTTARLTGGPITDLNVMTRRGAFRHSLTHHIAEGSKALRDSAGERLLLALAPLGVSTAEGLVGLQPLDALVLDGSEKAEVLSVGESATFYLVEITPA